MQSPSMGQQFLSAPPASGGPTPPPPPGSRSAWPPPPSPGTLSASDLHQPREPQLSDTMERMLRPQGLFARPQPKQYDWNSQWTPGAATASTGPTPVTGAAPPAGGQPGSMPTAPNSGMLPPPSPYPGPGGQYPPGNGYQTGAFPPAGGPTPPPPGYPANGGQVPPGGAPTTTDRYGLGAGQYGQGGYPPGQPMPPQNGQGQLPPGPYAPGQYGQTTFAGGQYGPGGQFGQGQLAPGQYGVDQYGATQISQGPYPGGQYGGPGQYGPGGQFVGPGGTPAPGQKPPRTFGKITLPRSPLIPAIGAAVLIAIVATAVILSMSGSSSTPPSNSAAGGGSTASPKASSSATGQSLTERQAAKQLAGLLSQSGSDHAAVTDAVLNVEGCGKNLGSDAQTFAKSASNRNTLLAKLAALPGRSSLPSAMVSDLTGAWKASAAVDTDLSKWAHHAATAGCHKGDLKYSSYQDSIRDDTPATNGKTAFVKLWNPLAKQDGLTTYQAAQL
jgi:hypothetical protein